MKLFDCTQCLMTLHRRRKSQRRRSYETTDPLVMTKRPSSRRQRPRRGESASSRRAAGSSRSKTRLLSVVRRFSASWRRGRVIARMTVARSKLEARPRPKKKLLAKTDRPRRVGISRTFNRAYLRKEIVSVETPGGNDTGQEDDAGGRRAGQLEREYYEHLEALKFLIDPPPCFRNTETRQNFENKLNSLDLRRMNTVAIPEGPVANGRHRDAKRLNGFRWSPIRENGGLCGDRERSCAKTLDRIVEERLRIERTMLDLFVKAPILKSNHGEQMPYARENKTVRFKDEVERTSVGQRAGSEGGERYDKAESSNRTKTEITRKKDTCRDGLLGESSEMFDVETRNGM
ncbi:uncharacterized protein LOC116841366 [Odontomachus brunneus]|uniref:uncharacterized protein LOC116841366 n=1 Tax=Odontomachus brunneus TaxID=486640 RepID=UPI0013F1B48E|nr:uncharacterized protein LOC116841366 [Odontomachus brunneus]